MTGVISALKLPGEATQDQGQGQFQKTKRPEGVRDRFVGENRFFHLKKEGRVS